MKPIPTSAELLERFKVTVEAAARPALATGQRLSWKAFSRWNLIRVGCVRLAERVLYIVEDRFRAGFLDTAEREDLDRWQASEAPGFPRKPASAATGRVTFTRSTSTSSGTIAAGTRVSTVGTASTPAVTFATVADVPVSTGQLVAYADVACEATGPTGNVDAGRITRILSPLFDTFTVSRDLPMAGGDAAETDEAFRDRLRQRDARYRRGTTQAVTLGALSVPGVSRVSVYDAVTNANVAAGHMLVVVGDASGLGSEPMADAVSVALREWAAGADQVAVYPAGFDSILDSPDVTSGSEYIRVTLTQRRGATVDRVATERAARLALAEVFAALDANAPLYLDQLRNAVLDVDSALLRVVFTVSPSNDLLPETVSAPTTLGYRHGAADTLWRFTWA